MNRDYRDNILDMPGVNSTDEALELLTPTECALDYCQANATHEASNGEEYCSPAHHYLDTHG